MRLLLGLMWPMFGVLSHAVASEAEIGAVIAASGQPVLQDTSGHAGQSAVMQPVHEDDIIQFASGDSVTICNESVGSAFEIHGPGTVRLTRSGVVNIVGSPDIRHTGPCEASATGDINGGVLLRTITSGKTH